MAKDFDPTEETVLLLDYLEQRGLTEEQAYFVMGLAMRALSERKDS